VVPLKVRISVPLVVQNKLFTVDNLGKRNISVRNQCVLFAIIIEMLLFIYFSNVLLLGLFGGFWQILYVCKRKAWFSCVMVDSLVKEEG